MSRSKIALALIVVVELIAAAVVIERRMTRPLPPMPNLERLDPLTAEDLKNLREAARGNSSESWRELAEAYMAFGYLPEAEACYRVAAEWDPASFRVQYGWAYCLERLGRTAEAIDQFAKAVKLADDELSATCHYHAGRCYLREESLAEAEAEFRKIPDFPPAALQLARILIRSGRAEEAIPLLERLDAGFPGAIRPLQLRAAAERELGRTAEAADYVFRAERGTDTLPVADHAEFLAPIRFQYGIWRELAVGARLRQSGNSAAAAEHFRRLADRVDDRSAHQLITARAEIELALGNPQIAVDLLNQLEESGSVTPETLLLLGDGLARLGRPEEARRAWERALQMRYTAGAHARLAKFHRERGAEQPALRHEARALHGAGVDAFRRDDLTTALRLLTQAVELDPDLDYTWYYLGDTRRARRENPQAVECYRRCLTLNPAHGRAAQALPTVLPPKGNSPDRADP